MHTIDRDREMSETWPDYTWSYPVSDMSRSRHVYVTESYFFCNLVELKIKIFESFWILHLLLKRGFPVIYFYETILKTVFESSQIGIYF